MKRITVQPGGDDRRVPVENLRGTFFEQGRPREVYHTGYIARRLACGDLVEAEAPSASAAGETEAADAAPAATQAPAAAATPAKGA